MYSDIIPPRKNNSIRNISLERFDELEPIAEQAYEPRRHPDHDRSFPKFFLFLIISVLIIGSVVYAKFIEHSTLTLTSKVTTLDIRERFALSVQKDDETVSEDVLYYNLIYISGKEKRDNPFAPVSTTIKTDEKKPGNTAFSQADLKPTIAVSTSTNSTTTVYLVNETKENIPLRATTRIDIAGVIYSLPTSVTVTPTKDSSIYANKQKYYLPGFKGTTSYNSIYAVKTDGPLNIPETTTQTASNTDAEDVVKSATSTQTADALDTRVPSDILSLLPETNIALKKNTIYDKITDQPAVVVFNKKDFLEVLEKNNPGLQEYVKSFNAVKDIVDFDVQIVDYQFDSSPDTGRPVSFKQIVIEIKPIFNIDEAKKAFENFSIDTIDKIRAQLREFASISVKNTPFWSKEVASEGKVEVIIEEK